MTITEIVMSVVIILLIIYIRLKLLAVHNILHEMATALFEMRSRGMAIENGLHVMRKCLQERLHKRDMRPPPDLVDPTDSDEDEQGRWNSPDWWKDY